MRLLCWLHQITCLDLNYGDNRRKLHNTARNALLEIGDIAPNFTLPTDSDGTMELHKTKQPVVLYFYPKDDTPGCTKEAIEFSAQRERFTQLGVAIMGASPDTAKKHDKFKAKHELNVTLVSDEEKSMLEAFGVWVEKSMYGRQYMGVERTTFLIDKHQKIVEIWRKVKVKGHVDAVLESAQRHFGQS